MGIFLKTFNSWMSLNLIYLSLPTIYLKSLEVEVEDDS